MICYISLQNKINTFYNLRESVSWSWHINTVFEDNVFYKTETLDLLKVNLKGYYLHNGNI